jgi:hypothetical protein
MSTSAQRVTHTTKYALWTRPKKERPAQNLSVQKSWLGFLALPPPFLRAEDFTQQVDEMSEDYSLIEVGTGKFVAIVPPFKTLPAEDTTIVLNMFLQGDKQGAFEYALSLFIDSLAPEKVNDFYLLEDSKMVGIVADWIAT